MKNPIENLLKTAVCLSVLLAFAGCASTKVSNRVENVSSTEKLPRPAHIWIYDFADSSAEIPAASSLAGQDTAPQTDEESVTGHEFGVQIAVQLAEEINGMGLSAVKADSQTKPAVNDIVIRGYLLTVDEGSAAKRVGIGFGSGGSELEVAVEGYQMTATGLRKLGSANVTSESGKMPGASLGAAGWIVTGNPLGLVVSGGAKIYGEASGSAKVEGRAKATAEKIAEELKDRFKQQGWID